MSDKKNTLKAQALIAVQKHELLVRQVQEDQERQNKRYEAALKALTDTRTRLTPKKLEEYVDAAENIHCEF